MKRICRESVDYIIVCEKKKSKKNISEMRSEKKIRFSSVAKQHILTIIKLFFNFDFYIFII